MPNLVAGSYPSFLENYLRLVEVESIDEAVSKYSPFIVDFFTAIPEDKISYRYAPGKWDLKEMLQHIIDTERIFNYRVLRIARKDKTPLAGFDENSFAAASMAGARSWQSLLQEFEAVRKSSDLLLKSFTSKQLEQTGTTNGSPNSAIAIAYSIFGHSLHHINIIKERYL